MQISWVKPGNPREGGHGTGALELTRVKKGLRKSLFQD